MGLFRKKGDNKTPTAEQAATTAGSGSNNNHNTNNNNNQNQNIRTEIKIVGNAKHVTTTTLDANGRELKQTIITKLTPDELVQYGRTGPTAPQAPAAAVDCKSHNVATPSDGDDSSATIEMTRELVKGFIADIWNRGDVDLIKKICHPSLRFNGHVGMDRVGHEGFAKMVITVREALTDYHCEIHSMVVESNKAFCRLKFTGKHTGTLLGYPPTGKTVSWVGASEFTCKKGQILKVWELGDVKTLEAQLRSAEV